MSGFSSPLANSRIRPSSEVYLNATPPAQNAEAEAYDKAAQKWLADLESYENTLEQMAQATLDQEFKDELSAIEQWFRVLSVAERTAALYALLQQTTPVQVRFFIAILQQMGQTNQGGILSPANFDKGSYSRYLVLNMTKLMLCCRKRSVVQQDERIDGQRAVATFISIKATAFTDHLDKPELAT